MKAIVRLLKQCNNDEELLVVIIAILTAYALMFFVFFEIHWMCGIMSPYVTTSIMRAGIKISDTIERISGEKD